MVAHWLVGAGTARAAETAWLIAELRRSAAECAASLRSYKRIAKQVAHEQQEMAAEARERVLASRILLRLSEVS
jgi:hypothetical protein